VRTYVSEALSATRRNRLRAGPFLSENDARQVLAAARTRYPKAWLAVADDATLNEPGAPDAVGSVPPTRPGGNATLLPADRERMLKQARDAFRRKDYAPLPLLTRLVGVEFPERAQALELLGLARDAAASSRMRGQYEESATVSAGEAAGGPQATRARRSQRAGERARPRRGRAVPVEGVRRSRRLPARRQFRHGARPTTRRPRRDLTTSCFRRRRERFDFASRAAGYGSTCSEGPRPVARDVMSPRYDRALD
jgi:hypothetical protein